MSSCAMKYLAIATLGILCIAGCRKKEDVLKVEVKNSTSETIEDIEIVLLSSRQSESRKISSLAPGESTTIVFPLVKGEGTFKVSGRQKGKAPYSGGGGYMENYSREMLIIFCPKPTPAGFAADIQDVQKGYTGGG